MERNFTPTSLLDIIENFVLFTHETDPIWDDVAVFLVVDEKPSFNISRYHQLDVIRRLKKQVFQDDV